MDRQFQVLCCRADRKESGQRSRNLEVFEHETACGVVLEGGTKSSPSDVEQGCTWEKPCLCICPTAQAARTPAGTWRVDWGIWILEVHCARR